MLVFRGRRLLLRGGRLLFRSSGFVCAGGGRILIGGLLLLDKILALKREDDLSGNGHADRHASAGWRLLLRRGCVYIGLRRGHIGRLSQRRAA
jgi:hypothetical protein